MRHSTAQKDSQSIGYSDKFPSIMNLMFTFLFLREILKKKDL